MVMIDISMPTDCVSCWIRQNMGCKIANNSGWLNNKRDENCPLKEVTRCKDCYKQRICYDEEVDDKWFCPDGQPIFNEKQRMKKK